MRGTIALCVMLFSGDVAYAEEDESIALERFQHTVSMAKERLGIAGVQTGILAKDEVEGGVLASIGLFAIQNIGLMHVVFVNRQLLQEGPDLILEHIAYHEMCHVARDDWRRLQIQMSRMEIETETEACVRKTVGNERYEKYLEAINDWRPGNVVLETARQEAVELLPKPDRR